MPCWIAAAHDKARLGPVNISITPSPVLLISIPPVAAAAPRRMAKWAWRSSSAASGPRRDASAVDPTRSVNMKVPVIGELIRPPCPYHALTALGILDRRVPRRAWDARPETRGCPTSSASLKGGAWRRRPERYSISPSARSHSTVVRGTASGSGVGS